MTVKVVKNFAINEYARTIHMLPNIQQNSPVLHRYNLHVVLQANELLSNSTASCLGLQHVNLKRKQNTDLRHIP